MSIIKFIAWAGYDLAGDRDIVNLEEPELSGEHIGRYNINSEVLLPAMKGEVVEE